MLHLAGDAVVHLRPAARPPVFLEGFSGAEDLATDLADIRGCLK